MEKNAGVSCGEAVRDYHAHFKTETGRLAM